MLAAEGEVEHCVDNDYDTTTLDFMSVFIAEDVHAVRTSANGGGVVECSVSAKDAIDDETTFMAVGYTQTWNDSKGLPNVLSQDGAVDHEFMMEEIDGSSLYTDTVELIKDAEHSTAYLYDPNGIAQQGVMCNDDGSAMMVEISASPDDSAPSMLKKVRTRGYLEELMLHFYENKEAVNEHFRTISEA